MFGRARGSARSPRLRYRWLALVVLFIPPLSLFPDGVGRQGAGPGAGARSGSSAARLVLPQAQAAGALGQGKVAARVLQDSQGGGPVPVVLRLRQQADVSAAASIADESARGWFVYRTLREHAERTQAGLLLLLRQIGVPHRSAWIANLIFAECDRGQIEQLAAHPDIAAIESNAEVRGIESDEIADRSLAPISESPRRPGLTGVVEWGVAAVRAPEVWALGYTGEGIVVANADTGTDYTHPTLRPHYRGTGSGGAVVHDYSWHDAIHGVSGNPCGSDAPAPCDDGSHGTHTAGTIVGDDGAGNQIGVAPGARFIACRNMDRGRGTPERYTECFQFFIAPTDARDKNPDPDRRPHVINNSWGCPRSEGCAPGALALVVANTQAAGIFVEASAGNAGPGCSTVNDDPAILPEAFAVGAYDSSGQLARFSSRGLVTVDGSGRLKPDVVAPGVRVRSSIPGGRFANFSGTSMAGPHVVGVVALLWSARPGLRRQIEATKALLRASATPNIGLRATEVCGGMSSDFVPNPTFGYGRVDALAAVTW